LSGFPNFREEFPNYFQDENAFLPMGQERLGIGLTTEGAEDFGGKGALILISDLV
tara:strand:+ start:164 stop:328 length:165 start_codon:yes stop_codon:yes gene_type:complete